MRKSTWIAIGIILGASLLAGQTIRITSPAIGADWCRGQSYTITWTSTGAVGASVRIRLMQGATAIQEITLNTRNSGTFAWPILASTPEGNYTVRVRSLENATMSDSAAFQISSCVTPPPASGFPMTLTSPAAGETLCAGRSYTIRWGRGAITAPQVRIQLLTQGFSLVRSFNEVIPNSGTYNWTVPAGIDDGPYKLHIEPVVQNPESPSLLAEGPVFRINHCYTVRPTITYTGPDNVQICDEIATIVWRTSGDVIRDVNIDFYCRTLPGGIYNLVASAPNTGSVRLRMPRVLASAIGEYGRFLGTIRISSAADPEIQSDGRDIHFIRCLPTVEETSRDIVLNPVDQLYLPAGPSADLKCESCLDFDLGKIKAALGDPSQPLSMTLYHSGQKVAELGTIGGGKTPPDRVEASISPEMFKLILAGAQDFAVILKTLEGKQVAKIPTEVIIQK